MIPAGGLRPPPPKSAVDPLLLEDVKDEPERQSVRSQLLEALAKECAGQSLIPTIIQLESLVY